MIHLYTKEDYAKSYTELLEILKYISYSDANKIPKEKLSYYEKYKDTTYTYVYNPHLCFEEQNISKLTLILIANLYVEYWVDDDERIQIKANDKKELYAIEMEKKNRYPTEDLFSKRKKIENHNVPITSMTVIDSKNPFKKLLTIIKKLFKLT